MRAGAKEIVDTILKIERAANERWNKGDCTGYFEIYAEDITYFDPVTAKVLAGRDAVTKHIRAIYKNPNIIRSEYINPEVALSDNGSLAVLAYNLRNFVADGVGEKLLADWNSTEVYRLIGSEWRIVHSHWSFVQLPAIMQNVSA